MKTLADFKRKLEEYRNNQKLIFVTLEIEDKRLINGEWETRTQKDEKLPGVVKTIQTNAFTILRSTTTGFEKEYWNNFGKAKDWKFENDLAIQTDETSGDNWKSIYKLTYKFT